MQPARPDHRTRAARRVALLLALVTSVVVAPIVVDGTAQPSSRYALTAALAEHGTVDIGRYERILGVDRALYEGELRSDKAPGQPLLGVPPYVVGRVLGLRSATDMRLRGDLGLWWQTLWTVMLPFVFLIALMFTTAARHAPRGALPAALAIGFGTFLLPHAVNLYGHVLAALFAYGAWCVLERSAGSRWSLVATGALASAAVAVEYHAVIAVLAIAAVALARWRRRCAWAVLGALPPLFATALYQWVAFGHPWRLPYAYYASKLGAVPTSEGGYSLPGVGQIVDVFAGKHGLLLVSPIVLVAIVAAVFAARQPAGTVRLHGLIALATTAGYLALVAGWSGTRLLEEPGPRYMIPVLPFLVVPLAWAWERMRTVAILTAAWGAVVAAGGAFTFILIGSHDAPFQAYVQRVTHGRFNATLWSMAFGRVGAVLYVATVAAAAAVLVRAVRSHTNGCSTDLVPTATLAPDERASRGR